MKETQIYSKLVSGLEGGHVTDYTQVEDVNLTKITCKQLQYLQIEALLVPGHKYQITDYHPTCNPDTFFEDAICRSAGHRFDIIVTALSHDTLSEDASAVHHVFDDAEVSVYPPDELLYFKNSDLSKWKLKISMLDDLGDYIWIEDRMPYYRTCSKVVFHNIEEFFYVWVCPFNPRDVILANVKKPDIPIYRVKVLEKNSTEDYIVDEINAIKPNGYLKYQNFKITYMKDEFENECWYDFKNILVLGLGINPTFNRMQYTFSEFDDGGMDLSLLGTCKGNVIKRISDSINPVLFAGACHYNKVNNRFLCGIIESSENAVDASCSFIMIRCKYSTILQCDHPEILRSFVDITESYVFSDSDGNVTILPKSDIPKFVKLRSKLVSFRVVLINEGILASYTCPAGYSFEDLIKGNMIKYNNIITNQGESNVQSPPLYITNTDIHSQLNLEYKGISMFGSDSSVPLKEGIRPVFALEFPIDNYVYFF